MLTSAPAQRAPQPKAAPSRAAPPPRQAAARLQASIGNQAVLRMSSEGPGSLAQGLRHALLPTARFDIAGGAPLGADQQRAAALTHGWDFNRVRVHSGPQAEGVTGVFHAKAVTRGSHIWLGRNQSLSNQRLVAHELQHVAQQAERRAGGLDGAGGDGARRAELEREADAAEPVRALMGTGVLPTRAVPDMPSGPLQFTLDEDLSGYLRNRDTRLRDVRALCNSAPPGEAASVHARLTSPTPEPRIAHDDLPHLFQTRLTPEAQALVLEWLRRRSLVPPSEAVAGMRPIGPFHPPDAADGSSGGEAMTPIGVDDDSAPVLAYLGGASSPGAMRRALQQEAEAAGAARANAAAQLLVVRPPVGVQMIAVLSGPLANPLIERTVRAFGETVVRGLIGLALIGAFIGVTGLTGGAAAVLLGGLMAYGGISAYLNRREEIEQSGYDVPVTSTIVHSVGDLIGLSQMIEAVTGVRLGTGVHLSDEQRADLLGSGAGTFALLFASRAFTGGRTLGAAARQQVTTLATRAPGVVPPPRAVAPPIETTLAQSPHLDVPPANTNALPPSEPQVAQQVLGAELQATGTDSVVVLEGTARSGQPRAVQGDQPPPPPQPRWTAPRESTATPHGEPVTTESGMRVPRYGVPQETSPGHAEAIEHISREMAGSGDYAYVVHDRVLANAVRGVARGIRFRSDIIAVRNDALATVDLVEVASPSDYQNGNLAGLIGRLSTLWDRIPANRRGTLTIFEPPSRYAPGGRVTQFNPTGAAVLPFRR